MAEVLLIAIVVVFIAVIWFAQRGSGRADHEPGPGAYHDGTIDSGLGG
jgi:hypothetical protein